MDTPTRLGVLDIAGRLDIAASEMDRARSDRDRLIAAYHARGNTPDPIANAQYRDATSRYYSARSRVEWLSAVLKALSQGDA